VTDNGLVSSRRPEDLDAFCAKMLEEIAEGRHERRHARARPGGVGYLVRSGWRGGGASRSGAALRGAGEGDSSDMLALVGRVR
jgi:hypothetical protein